MGVSVHTLVRKNLCFTKKIDNQIYRMDKKLGDSIALWVTPHTIPQHIITHNFTPQALLKPTHRRGKTFLQTHKNSGPHLALQTHKLLQLVQSATWGLFHKQRLAPLQRLPNNTIMRSRRCRHKNTCHLRVFQHSMKGSRRDSPTSYHESIPADKFRFARRGDTNIFYRHTQQSQHRIKIGHAVATHAHESISLDTRVRQLRIYPQTSKTANQCIFHGCWHLKNCRYVRLWSPHH